MAISQLEKQIRLYLAKIARRKGFVNYGKLNADMHLGLHFELSCDRAKLGNYLGEISFDEWHENGRPMLSSITVLKDSTTPGPGFYELAESMNRPIHDKDKFWIDELQATHAFWGSDEGSRLIEAFEKELQ